MGFKQHISRTWQMIEQQVNDVPFRPDNETLRQIKSAKTQYLCGFRDLGQPHKSAIYIKLTSIDAEIGASKKKSHN